MKIKMILASLLLATAPGLALAQGCSHGHSQEAMITCADGLTWDAESGTCVTIASS